MHYTVILEWMLESRESEHLEPSDYSPVKENTRDTIPLIVLTFYLYFDRIWVLDLL